MLARSTQFSFTRILCAGFNRACNAIMYFGSFICIVYSLWGKAQIITLDYLGVILKQV